MKAKKQAGELGAGGSLSNVQPQAPRASRRAVRSAARVAKGGPKARGEGSPSPEKRGPKSIEVRLAEFLLAVANAVHHRDALKENRLDWGRDISPRMKPKHDLYDADFTAAYKDAREAGEAFRRTLIEDSAAEKAIYGWNEPVFGSLGANAGVGKVGEKRVFSDSLHLALLKRNPAYADKLDVTSGGEKLPAGAATATTIIVQTAIPEPKGVPK